MRSFRCRAVEARGAHTSEIDDIVRELELAHDGAPWHGPSRAAVPDDRVATTDDPTVGGGESFRVVLHGKVQHDADHTGQIALLKRMLRDAAS